MRPTAGVLVTFVTLFLVSCYPRAAEGRLAGVLERQTQPLTQALAAHQLSLGDAVFMRIFKQSRILEVWMQPTDEAPFVLFKRYDICRYSGALGPKQKEGDYQSPEGFYFVNAARMNPNSQFHLSFNIGFPNAFDRYWGRSGSFLMVHGSCVSVGCYAMTDANIEEIYTLAHFALAAGQPFFRVHIFPFALDEAQLKAYAEHPEIDFWRQLAPGYQWFERHKRPPNVEVVQGRYHFD